MRKVQEIEMGEFSCWGGPTSNIPPGTLQDIRDLRVVSLANQFREVTMATIEGLVDRSMPVLINPIEGIRRGAFREQSFRDPIAWLAFKGSKLVAEVASAESASSKLIGASGTFERLAKLTLGVFPAFGENGIEARRVTTRAIGDSTGDVGALERLTYLTARLSSHPEQQIAAYDWGVASPFLDWGFNQVEETTRTPFKNFGSSLEVPELSLRAPSASFVAQFMGHRNPTLLNEAQRANI